MFFTTLTVSEPDENDIILYYHHIFFQDGIVVLNPEYQINYNRVESRRKDICNSIQNASQSELNYFYRKAAWGVYMISDDTLTMQVFNGNMRMMLSDFFSFSTFTYQIISKDSLKFINRGHYDDKAGWKVKTAQVTSIDCNHKLTSGSAWIKREKWLYCENK